jgi:hypothetical protein
VSRDQLSGGLHLTQAGPGGGRRDHLGSDSHRANRLSCGDPWQSQDQEAAECRGEEDFAGRGGDIFSLFRRPGPGGALGASPYVRVGSKHSAFPSLTPMPRNRRTKLPIVYLFDVQRWQPSSKNSSGMRPSKLDFPVGLLAEPQHLARALPLPPAAGERELP